MSIPHNSLTALRTYALVLQELNLQLAAALDQAEARSDGAGGPVALAVVACSGSVAPELDEERKRDLYLSPEREGILRTLLHGGPANAKKIATAIGELTSSGEPSSILRALLSDWVKGGALDCKEGKYHLAERMRKDIKDNPRFFKPSQVGGMPRQAETQQPDAAK